MGNCASGGPGPVSHVEHAHRIVGHLQTAAVQADASAAQLAAHGAAVREAGGPFKKLEAAVAALLGAASGHASHGRPSRPAVAQPAAVEELLIARGPVPVHRVEELLDALALAYAAYPLPPKPSSKHSKPPKQLSEAEARQAVAKSAAKHGYGHLRPEDLLLVTTKAEVYEPAFYVAVDAARHRIVWCVRGTDSPADALTDLIADPEPLPGYPGAVAHGGMLRAALFVLKAGGPAVAAALAAHPGFSLFLTGHSLGAGTAALLCLLLRGNAQLLAVLGVKNAELVSAIVFCTPMALDYKSATALDRAAGGLPYLTSVIHAADPVPRLSAGTAGAAVSSAFHHLLPPLPPAEPAMAAPGQLLLLARGGSSFDVLASHSRPSRVVFEKGALGDHFLDPIAAGLKQYSSGGAASEASRLSATEARIGAAPAGFRADVVEPASLKVAVAVRSI